MSNETSAETIRIGEKDNLSITDELRRYISGPANSGISHICENAIANIADRIDEQHAKERDKAYDTGVNDGIDADKNAMGYIKPPMDADGVPIEIGDYLHCDETGKDFPCRGYCCMVGKDGERRWAVECSYDPYSGTSEYVSATRCRHGQPDSWERIIRDAQEYVTDDDPLYSVEELVERCRRLAGEAE